MFRLHWVCPVQGCLCFPGLHCSGSRLLYMEQALHRVQFQFPVLHKSADSVAPVFCAFPSLSGSGSQRLRCTLPGCGTPFPSAVSGSGSQRFGHPLPVCGTAFSFCSERPKQPEACEHSPRMHHAFPSVAPAHVAGRVSGRVSGSLDRNRGPVCRVGGGGFSGAEFAPFPSPLPPTSSRGWGGSSLEFLSPFVLRTAGSEFGPVNFSLLSRSLKKLPPTALRAFGLVLTLSNASRSSPFRPHLLVAGAGVCSTFLLGVAFRHVICGSYLIFPPS